MKLHIVIYISMIVTNVGFKNIQYTYYWVIARDLQNCSFFTFVASVSKCIIARVVNLLYENM